MRGDDDAKSAGLVGAIKSASTITVIRPAGDSPAVSSFRMICVKRRRSSEISPRPEAAGGSAIDCSLRKSIVASSASAYVRRGLCWRSMTQASQHSSSAASSPFS
jgi:hypothetical protein